MMELWLREYNSQRKPGYVVVTISNPQWLKTTNVSLSLQVQWFSRAVVLHLVTHRPKLLCYSCICHLNNRLPTVPQQGK